MPKFLIGWLLSLGANAIALILCSLIFSGFRLSIDGFVISLVVFAVLSAFFTWIVLKFLLRNAGSVVALTGLISTFLALLVTTLLTSGLTIDGVSTWILSTLLIWVISMFIWLLPGPWRTFKRQRSA